MIKVVHIAVREFVTTVGTKGFILGVLVMPLMMGVVLLGVKYLWNEHAPKIDGELAVVDPRGEVLEGLKDYLAPAAMAERRSELEQQIKEQTPEQLRALSERSPAANLALQRALGGIPTIRVVALEPGSDLEREKSKLREGSMESGGRLALAVIHDDAIRKSAGREGLGTYDLFIREKLDDRLEDEIKGGLRDAIVGARLLAAGLDRKTVEGLVKVGQVKSTTVTRAGEQATNEAFNFLVPMGFMILLLISVMTGGQYLMTTTIEEKSNRIVEVLLSAVSPMQLMVGKIMGQMVVGLLIIGLYAGMGIAALVSFTLFGLLDPWLFFYLIVFYLIAYFVVGSMMAAIGAAVNEPREAQSFMAPVMIVVMVPWILWMPITRNPNSMFATVTSFLPPINSFVMLLRMTSTTPPPWWQVWISIGVGAASVYAALWFAAKVFRVGLLLHGKPPNFATLVRWVRMA